jgi:hypothetical protein
MFADPTLVHVGNPIFAVFVIVIAFLLVVIDASSLGYPFVMAVFALPFITAVVDEGFAVFAYVKSFSGIIYAAERAFIFNIIFINFVLAFVACNHGINSAILFSQPSLIDVGVSAFLTVAVIA